MVYSSIRFSSPETKEVQVESVVLLRAQAKLALMLARIRKVAGSVVRVV